MLLRHGHRQLCGSTHTRTTVTSVQAAMLHKSVGVHLGSRLGIRWHSTETKDSFFHVSLRPAGLSPSSVSQESQSDSPEATETTETTQCSPDTVSSQSPHSQPPPYHDRVYYLNEERRSVSPQTPFFLGHAFEEGCRALLRQHGFDLTQCGGSGDEGVDLSGRWLLPSPSVRVVAQCKCIRRVHRRLSVAVVREWEGVLARLNQEVVGEFIKHATSRKGKLLKHGTETTLGLLLATTNLSKPAQERLLSSAQPMVFIWLAEQTPERMLSFLMNPAAQQLVPTVTTAMDPNTRGSHSPNNSRDLNYAPGTGTRTPVSIRPILISQG